ncbi:MAG: hypothetical protein NC293_03620 [Roseburia sp.]|nr:hypothetical protein [Roseburia sp.]
MTDEQSKTYFQLAEKYRTEKGSIDSLFLCLGIFYCMPLEQIERYMTETKSIYKRDLIRLCLLLDIPPDEVLEKLPEHPEEFINSQLVKKQQEKFKELEEKSRKLAEQNTSDGEELALFKEENAYLKKEVARLEKNHQAYVTETKSMLEESGQLQVKAEKELEEIREKFSEAEEMNNKLEMQNESLQKSVDLLTRERDALQNETQIQNDKGSRRKKKSDYSILRKKILNGGTFTPLQLEKLDKAVKLRMPEEEILTFASPDISPAQMEKYISWWKPDKTEKRLFGKRNINKRK